MNSKRTLITALAPLAALALLGLGACSPSTTEEPTNPSTTTSTTPEPGETGAASDEHTPTTDVDVSTAVDLKLDDGAASITEAGTYRLSGAMVGRVSVDVPGDGVVILVLDDLDLTNPSGSPLLLADAGEVVLWLADGTSNTISDAATYADTSEGAAAHAVDSDVDMTIAGGGELTVTGNNQDAINTSDGLVITSGSVTVSAVDDGINANDYLVVAGGTVNVTRSEEGLESQRIRITGGTLDITSADDGINVSGDAPEYIEITGGDITVDAEGDGVDSNGSATMSGGTLTVHGPTRPGNGALDSEQGWTITGGTVWAVSSGGMDERPSDGSQGWVMSTVTGSSQSEVDVVGPDGAVVGTFTARKAFSSVLFSSPDVVAGETYELQLGGTAVGSVTANQGTGGGMGPDGRGGRGGQVPPEMGEPPADMPSGRPTGMPSDMPQPPDGVGGGQPSTEPGQGSTEG